MEHRTKRDHPLVDLIAEYESMNATGDLIYLEERDFHELIDYYEDEDLIDSAIEVADHAMKQHPFSLDFTLVMARLLMAYDKPYRSLHIEAISPQEVEVFLLRAKAFSILGEPEPAQAQLTEATKIASTAAERIEVYLCEAIVCENVHDFDGMFEALASALRLNPANEEALERVWVSVELSKKYEDSIDLHRSLIERDAFLYQACQLKTNGKICFLILKKKPYPKIGLDPAKVALVGF